MARVIVMGIIGLSPFAGVAWQALHYLEGLRRLGHDVFYVEDTMDWPYDPDRESVTDDPTYTLAYLQRVLGWAGFGERWAYASSAAGEAAYGPCEGRLAELYRTADVLVNVTGSTWLRERHLAVPVRLYVESDPVQPQIEVALGNESRIGLLAAHTHHFTFGENIGRPECAIPVGRFDYRPTRQPVVVDWWVTDEPRATRPTAPFTTVASWQQSGKDIEWAGERYLWSKHDQFRRFLDLPSRVDHPFELALAAADDAVRAEVAAHGWRVRDAVRLSRDIDPYREYIRQSAAEFTVAKDQYVRPRSGWFSDRSACYLAAGKPVVTQDTGFGTVLPVGEGLFAFSSPDEATRAINEILASYRSQSEAARAIAREYFDASVVVATMLGHAGVA